MTKKYRYLLLGVTAAAILSGCGKDEPAETEAIVQESQEDAASVSETETETAENSDTITSFTPSDYLVANASDYVKLSSYEDLSAVQYTYTITDDMVQQQILAARQEAGTEDDTNAPSAAGDTIYVTLKSNMSGDTSSDPEEEDTYFLLGDEDYGPEFDRQLTGLSTGDTKKFSVSFGSEIWNSDWAGNTVDFEVTVTGVTRLTLPEYDDAFLSEYTDFTTKQEYEDSIREALETEYDKTSYSDVAEELFSSAIDETTFTGYPQELYDTCREDVLANYSTFAGDDDTAIEDVLSTFGITDEDIDEETLAGVNRYLLVSALCQENNLEVTEQDYLDFVDENAVYFGAESAVDFENMYTRKALVWNLYEEKAANFLYQKASITKADYSSLFDGDDASAESEAVSEEPAAE